MIEDIHFFIFGRINKVKGRRRFAYFHLMGFTAFVASTIKHAKRGNRKLMVESVIDGCRQLVYVLKSAWRRMPVDT